MNRSARLQSARSWLKTYNGQNIASGYRKHFGIDWVCAFKELELLGIRIDAEYKENLLKSLAVGVAARRRRKLQRKEAFDEFLDQNETFAHVTGYTEAGFAYGVTWEEWKRLDEEDSNNPEADKSVTADGEVQDIPF
ncbi:MAG TPA: hypothetical protein VGJ66_25285 [Pyrinomonadaceae bacterium]|jgi:hypothetical protein